MFWTKRIGANNMCSVPKSFDTFLPVGEEEMWKYNSELKNLYLYVTRKQLTDILDSGALKLSRTSKTNDSTENLYAHDSTVPVEVRQYGYICLSSTINSSMMWGQYADRGKGACLVFTGVLSPSASESVTLHKFYLCKDRKKLIRCYDEKDAVYIHRVTYQDERIAHAPESPNLIKTLLTTKSTDWMKEHEYRILVPLKDAEPKEDKDEPLRYAYMYKILMPYLSRIVLGVNNEDFPEDVELSANKCLYRKCGLATSIRVVKATMNAENFSIDANLDKVSATTCYKG